ncbi:hypothetical protein G7046_g9654 [Stylonectria norvegica]|nr:hypothetical protein G7046_g9654 [Stylonectria norvegica]
MLSKTILALAALAIGPVSAIWPAPKTLTTGDKVLYIDQTTEVTYNGKHVCWNSAGPHDACERDAKTGFNEQMAYTYGYAPAAGSHFNSKDIVQAGVSRAFKAIFNDNFVPWKLRERNSNFEPDVYAAKTWVKSIQITQTGEDDAKTFKPLAGKVDESYTLTVSEKGVAIIKAKSSTGVLHALESFLQLFFKHSSGTFWYTPHAPISIQDKPQYPHRGILLDVARNWFEIEHIKRTIDAMAWNKMNRLHLHITDSQSWPLEIPALPKLAEMGAYQKGLSYSPADLADLHEYGIHRGVEVVLEIDMPGHIGVVQLAYKDLITAYDAQPYQYWCAEPPCGAFRFNNSGVYNFLDKLFDDLMPRIAPYTAYFHTGGDELFANDTMLDPGVKSNDTAVLAPFLQTFLNFVHGKVRKAGLAPMVWEEMITDWNMTLGKDVVVQSWLGGGAIKNLAEAGHQVIDSDYNYWYLDCGRGQWLTFDNGAQYQQFYPFADWCGPAKSWQLVYSHDPAAGLSKEAAKLVLGGEVAVWAETIDGVNLDTLVWPRASAAGEVLWSGRQDGSGQNRSQYDAVGRLAEMRERMVARGVGASPVQMIFCTQGNATDLQVDAKFYEIIYIPIQVPRLHSLCRHVRVPRPEKLLAAESLPERERRLDGRVPGPVSTRFSAVGPRPRRTSELVRHAVFTRGSTPLVSSPAGKVKLCDEPVDPDANKVTFAQIPDSGPPPAPPPPIRSVAPTTIPILLPRNANLTALPHGAEVRGKPLRGVPFCRFGRVGYISMESLAVLVVGSGL